MKKWTALLLASMVMLAGCSTAQKTTEEPKDEKESLTADIVVVGSGIAGMSAAVSAAQNGASVVLVEKQGYLGGSYFSSPGNMAVAEIEENKENHVQDSSDTLTDAIARYEERISDSKEKASYDRSRVESLLIESMNTVAWQQEMGIVFDPFFTIEMNGLETLKPNVPEIEKGLNGGKCMQKMASIAEGLSVQLMTGTTATSLVVEEGTVKGIVAEDAEGSFTINAKQVILATGGFGGNEEMVLEAVPALKETGYYFQGIVADKGDGIVMAEAAGAATYADPWLVATTLAPASELLNANRQFAKLVEGMCYTVHFEGEAIEDASIADHLLVNAKGERIVNEAGDKSKQLAALLDSHSGSFYALYTGAEGELAEILESGVETGFVMKADSLEGLAEAAKMDSATLAATVTAYNEAVAKGVDEQFNKPIERMHEIKTEGTLYLVRVVPSFVATMGGLITNTDYQVLNEEKQPIEGLYAVGEVTHNFLYSRHFVAGASNGFSATMGRLAGAHAAEKATK